jgi:hypothetical protein
VRTGLARHCPIAPAARQEIDGGRQPRPCRRPYRLPSRASLRGQCRKPPTRRPSQLQTGQGRLSYMPTYLGTQHQPQLVIVAIVVAVVAFVVQLPSSSLRPAARCDFSCLPRVAAPNKSYHHGFLQRDSPARSSHTAETAHASSWANCDALLPTFLMPSAPVCLVHVVSAHTVPAAPSSSCPSLLFSVYFNNCIRALIVTVSRARRTAPLRSTSTLFLLHILHSTSSHSKRSQRAQSPPCLLN